MNFEQSGKPYHSSHSLVYNCQSHVIWCPKYRTGHGNHAQYVHLLLDANPQIGIMSIVGKIKGYTSHVLRIEYS